MKIGAFSNRWKKAEERGPLPASLAEGQFSLRGTAANFPSQAAEARGPQKVRKKTRGEI